jgi:hypothetical protein
MDIKPFRQYNENDVINFYAFDGATASKGTFVELKAFAPNNQNGYSTVSAGANLDGTWSYRHAVNARVTSTASGSSKTLGMLVYDVKEVDENGELLKFKPKYKRDALNCVLSGESVPVLTRGVVEIIGFQGTPEAGSGAFVSNSGDGSIVVALPSASLAGQKVGKFLSSTGADGYALLKIEL